MTGQRIINELLALFFLLFLVLPAFNPDTVSAEDTYLNERFLKAKIKASLRFSPNDFGTLLVDFMVNNKFDTKAVDRSGNPQALYFYQANEKIGSYLQTHEKKDLNIALEAVNAALRHDPDNALLDFLKSYVEHSSGRSGKAYETFKRGCIKNKFSAYHDAVTQGLISFLNENDSFNAYNCFYINIYWQKITLNKDMVVYTVKTARNYFNDPHVPQKNKKVFHGLMCNYLNRKEYSLDLLRSTLFLVADNIVKKAPSQMGVEQCPDKYSASVNSAAEEAMRATENYHRTKDLRYLNESLFWKNFQELSK